MRIGESNAGLLHAIIAADVASCYRRDCGNDKITLTRLILIDEVGRPASCVKAVPGVTSVDNKVEVHEVSEHIASL
jgi:hypothetical protein